ncbi:MAG: helix-hairpin-helix domain-containing protein [Bacteroidota bacterium]
MDTFTQFIDGLTTEESMSFIAFILGGFLLGILLGLVLRGGRIRRLKKELASKNEENLDLQAQNNTLAQKNSVLESDLKKAKFEKDDAKNKLTIMEGENAKLHKNIFQLNSELKNKEGSAPANNEEIDRLQEINKQLNLENKELKVQLQQTQNLLAQASEQPKSIAIAPSSTISSGDSDSNTNGDESIRLDMIEKKLAELEQENEELNKSLSQLKGNVAFVPSNTDESFFRSMQQPEETYFEDASDKAAMTVEPPFVPTTTNKSTETASAPTNVETVPNSGQIVTTYDDLTLIEGIGPFIEKKLNEIGITTYQQISEFDDKKISEVTKAIQFFEGRIQKDNWVGQAMSLYQIKMQNPAAFQNLDNNLIADIEAPNPIDDLTLIEGIGPKIEGVLKANGIQNISDLAAASATHLKEILESAGNQYKMHDPTTWPAQARLADLGDWEVLKEYQDKLKGGKE